MDNGSYLYDALKEAGLTQAVAAQRLGVSRQTLNVWLQKASLSTQVKTLVKAKLGISIPGNRDGSPMSGLLNKRKSDSHTHHNHPELLTEYKSIVADYRQQVHTLTRAIADMADIMKRLPLHTTA